MTAVRACTGFAVALTIAMLAGCSSIGWRAQEIDGSSAAAFERSVASLQGRLTPRRRAELETALAIIWLRTTGDGAADRNSDSFVDVNEIRALQVTAEDTLTEIRRGVFAASSLERSAQAADYLKQLDGLSHYEVTSLAAATSGEVFLAAVKERRAAAQCEDVRVDPKAIKSSFMLRYCARR
jgi:hypothetical protein